MIADMEWNESMERRAVPRLLEISITQGLLYYCIVLVLHWRTKRKVVRHEATEDRTVAEAQNTSWPREPWYEIEA
jgi:hypothetical protein